MAIPSITCDPETGPLIYLQSPNGSLTQLYLNNNGQVVIGTDALATQEEVRKTIVYNYSFVTNASVPFLEVKSVDWNTVATFCYFGTVSTPITFAHAIVELSKSGTGDIRVFDVTNNTIICEGSYTCLTKAGIDLGTLNNLPSSNSMFELQLKADSISTGARVYSFMMGY